MFSLFLAKQMEDRDPSCLDLIRLNRPHNAAKGTQDQVINHLPYRLLNGMMLSVYIKITITLLPEINTDTTVLSVFIDAGKVYLVKTDQVNYSYNQLFNLLYTKQQKQVSI